MLIRPGSFPALTALVAAATLAITTTPTCGAAQDTAVTRVPSGVPSGVRANDWRLNVTIFRSPGTGVQLSRGAIAVFAAHYPTILTRAGAPRTTHFVRVGIAGYLRPAAATSPYASLSVAPSLTRGWSTSGLLDAGVRQRVRTTWSAQLGVAVLHAPARRATRVNPTVGLGVSF